MKYVSQHSTRAKAHTKDVDFICQEYNVHTQGESAMEQLEIFKVNKFKKAKTHVEKFMHEAAKNPKVFHLL